MPGRGGSAGRLRARRARNRPWGALLWVAPALLCYAAFVLYPLGQSIQYSFYNWDGIGTATPAGLANWQAIFTQPELLSAITHAFELIVFYTLFPVAAGLAAASLIRELKPGPFSTISRTILFIPQVLPLVAAGVAWTWLYSSNGLVNQILRAIGLGGTTRAWLGDFTFALPAVGVIGVWVMLGFCTVLLLSGIGKIDPALYEAASLDGAGPAAAVPRGDAARAAPGARGLHHVHRRRGAGELRRHPGLHAGRTRLPDRGPRGRDLPARLPRPADRPGFRARGLPDRAGPARRLAHPAAREDRLTQLATTRRAPVIRGSRVVRGDRITRTVLLVLLMLFAIVPLLSMFTAALAPQGSNPPGLSWPAHPHWGNFADAWTGANLFALFRSSVLIVLGVVPAAVAMATAAGYGLAQLRVPGGKVIYGVLLAGLTIPYEALITPLYYDIQSLGLLGSRLAVVLPLIGLLMPFGVFWMRAHFVNAETALTEAGQLDGGSTWQIFRRIHLPLAKPAISALTILFFLATWNQYLLPLVLIDDPAKRTVGRRPRRVPGAVRNQHRAAVRRITADHRAVAAGVPRLPAQLRQGAAAGGDQVRRLPAAGPRTCPAGRSARRAGRGSAAAACGRHGATPRVN